MHFLTGLFPLPIVLRILRSVRDLFTRKGLSNLSTGLSNLEKGLNFLEILSIRCLGEGRGPFQNFPNP